MSLTDRTPPTADEYVGYQKRLCNWGRWGKDDELGTLNFITDDVRRSAARLVTEGRTVSCSLALDTRPGFRNLHPAQHFMKVSGTGSTDYYGVSYHGYATTHIDALCHIFTEDGRLYDGRPVSAITTDGASTCSIDHWRDGIVTRGVLYDIPRLRGTKYVTGADPVHGWDLADAAKAQGVQPRSGDAVLVRCGGPLYWAENPPRADQSPTWRPGVHASALEFLHETEASLLGWDQLDASDQGYPGVYASRSPVHALAIPYMGLPLLDNADFDRLAEVCQSLGRWEFEFVISPLFVQGGTGSPANPLAIF